MKFDSQLAAHHASYVSWLHSRSKTCCCRPIRISCVQLKQGNLTLHSTIVLLQVTIANSTGPPNATDCRPWRGGDPMRLTHRHADPLHEYFQGCVPFSSQQG